MKYLILACLISLGITSYAQARVVTGRIIDKVTQQPIKNANIIVQGTTSGSVSDSMGVFHITLKPNFKSLLISHVSYEMLLVDIPEADKFRVELEKIFVIQAKVILYHHPPELAPLDSTNITSANISDREVEQNASFIGGIEYLNYFLTSNYKYPKELNSFTRGATYVSFEVGISGIVENIKIHDDSLNLALRQTLEELFISLPAWRPAYQRGEPVTQNILVPIIYGPNNQPKDTNTYLNYYLAKTIVYPAEAVRLAMEGTVYVYFSLNSRQDFTRLEIIQGIGSGCDEMVYNSISSIPKAELKSLMKDIGDSVFVLPVDFRLDQSSISEDELLNLTEAVFLMPLEVLASQLNNHGGLNSIFIGPTSEFYSMEGALKHIDNALKLHIVDRQLTSLSVDVGKLENLLLLNLENNELATLPETLADLVNLAEFYAPQNKLSSLPIGVSNMNQLKIIGLAYNNFTEFPEELLDLKRLRAIDLSDNKISMLPVAIGNLKNLKTLILRNNRLQDLPDEFFRLKLTELHLQGNDLSEELKIKIKNSFKNAVIIL